MLAIKIRDLILLNAGNRLKKTDWTASKKPTRLLLDPIDENRLEDWCSTTTDSCSEIDNRTHDISRFSLDRAYHAEFDEPRARVFSVLFLISTPTSSHGNAVRGRVGEALASGEDERLFRFGTRW